MARRLAGSAASRRFIQAALLAAGCRAIEMLVALDEPPPSFFAASAELAAAILPASCAGARCGGPAGRAGRRRLLAGLVVGAAHVVALGGRSRRDSCIVPRASRGAVALAIASGSGGPSFGKSRFHQATRASKRRTTCASRAASLCARVFCIVAAIRS
jgi:hypothetical protein